MFEAEINELGRIAIVGILSYIILIVFLRVSGKRTLSKMNAFDLIVTVALGSTLATVLLDKDVSLPEGVFALLLLVFLQYVVAWLAVRVNFVNRMIKSQPVLLYSKGEFLRGAMKKERIHETEIYQAARTSGISALEDVEAVILETDGSISVLKKSGKSSSESTLKDVDE
ncbi:DUF421 domain-containing protein [Evansella clarkii]|jgi:uncharacterized membrane protein YcaP (DUF421 family)|uniref:DUF421 domain-containing protein n=1 Tax=Evansella clarkii TaxID=79879 RepID=UPI0009976E3B|nr:YetF domain-containing protein [Evansella clarkii]